MEHEEKTPNECYQYNLETRTQLTKLEDRHDKFATRVFDKLDELDKNLMSRLPIWATLFISFLMLIIGSLLARALK